VPTGATSQHEVKFDGHRAQAHMMGSRRVIRSRNGHECSLSVHGPRVRQ